MKKSDLKTIEKVVAIHKAMHIINPELAAKVSPSHTIELIHLYNKWETETIEKLNTKQS